MSWRQDKNVMETRQECHGDKTRMSWRQDKNVMEMMVFYSPVNILKDPPQIATEGFSMVFRPEGFLE